MTGPHEIKDALSNMVTSANPQALPTSSLPPKDQPQPFPSEDSVTLSPLSQEPASIHEAIARLPEVRTERMDRIRQALNAGTYRVASEQIADRIILETIRNSRHLP